MEEILKAKSVEDLEVIGSVGFLKSKLEEAIEPLKAEAETYGDIFELLEKLRKNWLPFSDCIFTSRRQEIIYYLLDHDGEKRNNLLGITDEMYESRSAAKKWYKQLAQVIRADVNMDARSVQAFHTLQEILSNLIDDEEFGGGDE